MTVKKKYANFPPSLLFKEKLISWLLTAKKQYNIRQVLIMKANLTNIQHP